jgi:flagellar motility protein MotE (MotC chaperone)
MKKDNEVEKDMRETTALVKETHEVFLRSFDIWRDRVVSDLMQSAEKLRREGRTDSVVKELASISESMKELLATMKKSNIRRTRAMKVVLHKNEAHANDRLVAVLERMKRDHKQFQSEMQAHVKAKKPTN